LKAGEAYGKKSRLIAAARLVLAGGNVRIGPDSFLADIAGGYTGAAATLSAER